MRVLVSGSRHWEDIKTIASVLQKLPAGTTIIHGDAVGVDTIADVIAKELGFTVQKFPVTREDWAKMGRAAGPIRNKKMLMESQPDLVIAFLDESKPSPGTKNMIKLAESYGFQCMVVKPDPNFVPEPQEPKDIKGL